MRVENIRPIDINEYIDPTGSLRVVENLNSLFNISRIYWLSDLRKGCTRGVHAHKSLKQIYLPIEGKFSIRFHDGTREKSHIISKHNKSGLYVPSGLWREITGLATNNLLLVLASEFFDLSDYIFSFDEYLLWKSLNE